MGVLPLAYNGMRNNTDFSRYHADISIPIMNDFYAKSYSKKFITELLDN